MQVTYQKNDGSIFLRYRNTLLPYKIGEITSMGWKVLNIEYEYKNKYYSKNEYHKLINKKRQASMKQQQRKEFLKNELKTFIHYFIAILILNCLKYILGI